MPIFDCARAYSGSLQECRLALTDCLQSCDIASLEPGWQLVADTLFCALRQTACYTEHTYCYEDATLAFQQCCQTGGPVVTGCTGIFDPARGSTLGRRFRRYSAADYWAIWADVHGMVEATFGGSLALLWVRAHIAERLLPTLGLLGAANASNGAAPALLALRTVARHEIKHLDSTAAVPRFRREFRREIGLNRRLLTDLAAHASDRLAEASVTAGDESRFAAIERKVRRSGHWRDVDYRNRVRGPQTEADFEHVVTEAVGSVRARLDDAGRVIRDDAFSQWPELLST